MGRTWMVANQPMASSSHGNQRAAPARTWRPPGELIAPQGGRALDGRLRCDATTEAFLLHVEVDGAPDGGIHVGGGRPAQIAPRRLDVGYAYLDVLVVLAVVLARGHILDLRGTGVVAQRRKLLGDADGALRQIADRDAVVRVADVEDAPAGAAALVLDDGEQALDRIVDVGEGALLAAAGDQLDRTPVEHVGEELREHARAAFLRLFRIVEIRADEVERPEQRVIEIVAHSVGVDDAIEQLFGGGVYPALLVDRAVHQ